MGSVTALHPAMARGRYLGPATVTGVDDGPGRAELEIPSVPMPCVARNAITDRGPLTVGEEVLAVGDLAGELYVIGRLSPAPAAVRLPLPGGGHAAIETAEGLTTLRVYSPRDSLILEYDPAGDRTRLTPEGRHLEIAAPLGNLALSAAGEVAIEGGAVAVRSRSGIALAAEDGAGAARSVLLFEGGTVRLAAPAIDIATRQASLKAEEARYTGRSLLAELASLRLVAGRVETLARTVVEKTCNLYRNVEELLETRAGRVRSLVAGTYHLKARDAVVRAERDVDLDGEKIRLG